MFDNTFEFDINSPEDKVLTIPGEMMLPHYKKREKKWYEAPIFALI